jgi:hypothetical protein
MHYPPILNVDLSEHLRQLSVTASTNHERRVRARQDAAARKRRWRRADPAPRACGPTAKPAPAS